MGFLAWLQGLPLSIWVQESPSVWAQPTVMTLHTMGMSLLVGASWVLDLRLLGISRKVPLASYRWVFRVVAIAFTVNLVTGVLLFVSKAETWGRAFPFLVKMLFVAASVASLVPIRKLVLASGPEQVEVPANARLLAIASILAWSGAIIAGRLLAYLVP
ncbi:MAG TPA: hypothetical protein VFX19_12485 [Dehalococcoidia bacterium]|nr:hypothetical protein [Dehalococcoidia bacterium]